MNPIMHSAIFNIAILKITENVKIKFIIDKDVSFQQKLRVNSLYLNIKKVIVKELPKKNKYKDSKSFRKTIGIKIEETIILILKVYLIFLTILIMSNLVRV